MKPKTCTFKRILPIIAATVVVLAAALWAENARALSANKVWFEFRRNGMYRVYVGYTVPALREYREVWTDFKKKTDAETYYWDLVRGADFYIPDPKARRFTKPPVQPSVW